MITQLYFFCKVAKRVTFWQKVLWAKVGNLHKVENFYLFLSNLKRIRKVAILIPLFSSYFYKSNRVKFLWFKANYENATRWWKNIPNAVNLNIVITYIFYPSFQIICLKRWKWNGVTFVTCPQNITKKDYIIFKNLMIPGLIITLSIK